MDMIRARKLADLVADHSLDVQRSDTILVQAHPMYSQYAGIMAQAVKDRGARAILDVLTYNSDHISNIIKYDRFKEEGQRTLDSLERVSGRVLIDCEIDTLLDEFTAEERKKYITHVSGPFRAKLKESGDHDGFKRKRTLVGFPSNDYMHAFKSVAEMEDFVYNAALQTHWDSLSTMGKSILNTFDNAKEVRIVTDDGDTDLRFSLADRKGKLCDGKLNLPDGEVYYAPIEDSVNGKVKFHHPVYSDFGVIRGPSLLIQQGVIIGYDAWKNRDGLNKLLSCDTGASQIGEFGIGINPNIERVIGNALFDEKIAGTIHLAVGQACNSYPQPGGGKNVSNVHQDMVCDLRQIKYATKGGRIIVDDRVVMAHGIWNV